MGNIKKIGTRSPIQGLIRAGEHVPHPGVWILDLRAPGIDGNATSGFAMSGAHMDVFSTGRGSPLGNAVMPTLKLTGNPKSYAEFDCMLDFNAGVVIEGQPMEQAGKDLYDMALEVIEGKRLTKTEINGNREFFMMHPED